jgi:hypothetical protein
MMIPLYLLSTGRNGAAPGWPWLEHLTASGEQIYFEDVVNLFFEHNLQPFAQTGRWSDNSQYRPLRQETNLSFSGRIEVNSHEGLFCAIRLPNGSVLHCVARYRDRIR